MRPSPKNVRRALALLVGAAILALALAGAVPGPWHEEGRVAGCWFCHPGHHSGVLAPEPARIVLPVAAVDRVATDHETPAKEVSVKQCSPRGPPA